MFGIITTVALCYLAVGIYVMLVFDHADERLGREPSSIRTQFITVTRWPLFLHFIANEDDILVEFGDE